VFNNQSQSMIGLIVSLSINQAESKSISINQAVSPAINQSRSIPENVLPEGEGAAPRQHVTTQSGMYSRLSINQSISANKTINQISGSNNPSNHQTEPITD